MIVDACYYFRLRGDIPTALWGRFSTIKGHNAIAKQHLLLQAVPDQFAAALLLAHPCAQQYKYILYKKPLPQILIQIVGAVTWLQARMFIDLLRPLATR